MYDKEWVESIVKEVLANLEKGTDFPKPILHLIQSEDVSETMLHYLQSRWEVEWVNPEEVNGDKKRERVLFPSVSQDLFVKGALGITDTHESALFSELVRRNSQIIFKLSSPLHVIIDEKASTEVPQAYVRMLSQYKEILSSFGVQFSIRDDLSDIQFIEEYNIPEPKLYQGQLVTQREMESWEGKEMYLEKHTIITPLAKDKAKERNINLLRNDS
ncbi:hypothetical protein GLW05_19525 [Pontibacillus yanchengensis]|uniref:Ethanolamine utilization protein n=1 Tax=Pontibacillus yanchengensis TaxID=462910 RepID=A0A6I5A622_9BACI|nr:hypothetical protein [Pontibacillus yanchengensis]MYL35767.1 hypothetical protein [Pontibacillus yanchengensis]